MPDIPLADAVLLYNSDHLGGEPDFVVRPLGHPDYDRYFFKVGACFRDWQEEKHGELLKLRLLIEAWHATAFYGVPATMIHEALICIPEYRDMLADDCLPDKFRHERH